MAVEYIEAHWKITCERCNTNIRAQTNYLPANWGEMSIIVVKQKGEPIKRTLCPLCVNLYLKDFSEEELL